MDNALGQMQKANGINSTSKRHPRISGKTTTWFNSTSKRHPRISGKTTTWFLGNELSNDVFVFACKSEDQISVLNRIGIEANVIVCAPEENLLPFLPADEYVKQQSTARTLTAVKVLEEQKASYDIIIGFDTVIVIDDEIIGKPKDANDALSILCRLNDRWHTVYSGVTLIDSKQRIEKFHVETKVQFGNIPAEMFQKYIKSGECFNQAGAYDIRGIGAAFVKCLSGDFSGIAPFSVYEFINQSRKPLICQQDANNIQDIPPVIKTYPVPLPRTFVVKLSGLDDKKEAEDEEKKEICDPPTDALEKSFETNGLNNEKENQVDATSSDQVLCKEDESNEELPKSYNDTQKYVDLTDFSKGYRVTGALDSDSDLQLTHRVPQPEFVFSKTGEKMVYVYTKYTTRMVPASEVHLINQPRSRSPVPPFKPPALLQRILKNFSRSQQNHAGRRPSHAPQNRTSSYGYRNFPQRHGSQTNNYAPPQVFHQYGHHSSYGKRQVPPPRDKFQEAYDRAIGKP